MRNIKEYVRFLSESSLSKELEKIMLKLVSKKKQPDVEDIKKLLDSGVSPDAKDRHGYSALHYACSNGHYDVAKTLIDHNANVNLKEHNGMTPLHRAAIFSGSKDATVRWNEQKIIKLLIDAGAELNEVDSAGRTALHWAMLNFDGKYKDHVSLLINSGADVNAKNKKLRTPLHECVSANNNIEALNLFISAGAKIEERDEYGMTPLNYLSITRHVFDDLLYAKTLIDAGADVKTQDDDGNTPLHMLAQSLTPRPKFMKILLENGANIEQKNKMGQTPLEIAIDDDTPLAAKAYNARTLIESGANLYPLLKLGSMEAVSTFFNGDISWIPFDESIKRKLAAVSYGKKAFGF